jgi:ankyrin repeat protein
VWGFDTAKATALLDGGVDVNEKDAKGTHPLLLACSYKDNDEMVQLLLEKGADPNIFGPNGETPLGMAVRRSFNAVKMLVEKGADVNAKHEKGETALWWAIKMEEKEVAEYLRENGAKE